nr:PAS and ANTAR domain-containing protein [Nocardia blacklockiae]
MSGSVTAARRQATGSFRFWFADQRWEWSDELARMHGYEPGAVRPTTHLLLEHNHPDDRARVADAIAYSLQSGQPLSSRHRFLDTAGHVHEVVVVAERLLDDSGGVVGTSGYYIDLTDALAEQRRQVLDDTMPDVVEARAVIEQAKGVLMRVYDLNADQAFRVLRWRSQETNTKLRVLAQQLIADLARLAPTSAAERSEFDDLLLTARRRVREN